VVSDVDRWQRVKGVFDAALEQPAAERATFVGQACDGDEALREEVLSLLRAHEQAGSFLSVPALATFDRDWTGRRIGPYQVLGEVGHGGMGVVYRATRDDDVFQKIVALKVVHDDAGPEAARRFARERRILARLQHPNIATILDGGETEDGRPYLVMEHVDGVPIDVFCERHALGVRQRLELFRAVCGAVHAAHQNLIIHRDLKPANVLVSSDGQPKLLDFGIAALLAPDEPAHAPTMTVPAMTPGYASPEQVRGLPLTTASDVYSLGVVAYELLTGELPLRARGPSLEDMVRTVCDTEPDPPSVTIRKTGITRTNVAASALRGDLDTIVLKALRKEPERRYLSAQVLAEDIDRFLAGRPVLAQKDTPGYRLRKFVGRHRAGVAAAAAVVVSLIAGLVGVLHQARIAEANRLRAERRFADVRRMANSLLFELHDAVKDLPGSTAARSLVLRRALEYLDGLAREAGGDANLQEELATAYQRVAEVQGTPSGANLGDAAGATESLRKEVALRQALAARNPRDGKRVTRWVGASRRLALLEDEVGQTQAGRDRLGQALSTIEEAVARDPGANDALRESARIHRDLGQLLFKTGDRSAALEHQRRALAVWKAERDAHLDDPDVLRELYLIQGDVARTLSKAGALPESLEHYRGAMVAAEARLRLRPEDPVARQDANTASGNLAVGLRAVGQGDEALRTMVPVLAFDEDRLRADPRDSKIRRDLMWDLTMMAQLAFDAGRFEEARGYFWRSQEIAEARLRDDPTSFQALKDVAEGLSGKAELLVKLERLEEAAAMSKEAIAAFERLRAQNPDHARVVQLLADVHAGAAEIHERMAVSARGAGRQIAHWREARAAGGQAVALWRELDRRGALDEDRRARLPELTAAVARYDMNLARLAGAGP